MTFVATSAATAAAARQARMLRREEEEMTEYQSDEVNGWEFKIVRSATARFKRPEVVRGLVEEEGRAGWELLEKFDDSRIRFKRRVEHRADDAHRDIDPYRTRYRSSPEWLRLAVLAVVLGLGVLGAVAFFWLAG
ncbi:MAG: hypothetical protein O7A98_11790 [Acidobacteria bacterium]|nr:hypothetical protein [Acidobacteriota bacterium]